MKYVVFGDCVFVEGNTQALLCDINRMRFWEIPLELYAFIKKRELLSGDLKLASSEILQFVSFLIKNELLFELPNSIENRFPAIDFSYQSPGIINHAILEISSDLKYNLFEAVPSLIKVGVTHLQFVSLQGIDIIQIGLICELIMDSAIRSVELIFKYSNSLSNINWEVLLTENRRIKTIFVHSSPDIFLDTVSQGSGMGNIVFTTQCMDDFSEQGVTKNSFNLNMDKYCEALHFNPAFYKKVCVTKNGSIKNSLNQVESFGSINTKDLATIVANSEFTRLWHSRKDNVLICKNCEYRYVCNDQRIPVAVSDTLWEHSSNCNYDPLKGIWNDFAS